MTITAKFASVCPCCNDRIQPGEKVEWSKGEKARHVACALPCASSVASATYRSGPRRAGPTGARRVSASNGLGRRTGCSCGSQEGGSKPSDCWSCKHDA